MEKALLSASEVSGLLTTERSFNFGQCMFFCSQKFTEDLSASKVKLEEQLSFSKEELSSLCSACKELEDTPSPTEEQKETLRGHKVKMESLEVCVNLHRCMLSLVPYLSMAITIAPGAYFF